MRRFWMAEAPGRRAWVIPLMGVAAGVGLSFLTVAIDRHYPSGLLPGSPISSATDAQYILTTIAGAVVPLTTTVLTVTLVAVQLAMGQFSPRIVRALLDDRSDQVAIAVFAATFTFALLSLRAVATGRGPSVPAVTVLTGLALAIASGVALFFFISHAGYRLRVAGLVDLVGDELRKELAKRYPAQVSPSGQNDPSVVAADHSGNVIYVDEQALVATAHRADCVLALVPMMGDFVVAGGPLFRIHGDPSRLDRKRARSLVRLGDERTHRDDPAYGFRKLVDVAQRSLGTAQNDATTAVQVINRLHDCLRHLAPSPFPTGHHLDPDGELRLIVRCLDWDGYIRLAFDEIRLAAGGYPQATRRLRAALDDLKAVAPPDRQAPLDRQLRLLGQAVRRDLYSRDDIDAALIPDQQGIGSGADVAPNGLLSAQRQRD